MKRKLISLLLLVVLCLQLAVCAGAEQIDFALLTTGNETSPSAHRDPLPGEQLVMDGAQLLSDAEESALNDKLITISQAYNAQVLVATVSALDVDVTQYLEYLYDSSGFGYGENHDGVLLLVCMNPREYRILSNGFAGDAITETDIENIGDAFVSDLSDGNYAAAFNTFADECEYYLNGYINGFPFDPGATLLTALAIGFVISLIVTGVWRAQLKSVRRQYEAGAYVKAGSLQLTQSGDYFMYRTVTKTERPQNNSSGRSSGGGGSRSIGGGSF